MIEPYTKMIYLPTGITITVIKEISENLYKVINQFGGDFKAKKEQLGAIK